MDLSARVAHLNRQPALNDVWRYLDEVLSDIIAEAIVIQQIPAPTFYELVRANHVLSRLGACGLIDTRIDSLYNTIGRLPGSDPEAPAVLVTAHTDTVFPSDTDLTIRHTEDGRIYGPGLGDNSLGVAVLIALADVLRQFLIRPRRDIWFAATSREEGLGNMEGIRAIYDRYGSRFGLSIVLEGLAFGRIYHVGIPVRRLNIICRGEGGHSWQHFGRPNAIHTLVQLAASLTHLDLPAEPRTTYNIGVIKGGHSVNSLATEAELYLDLRSESPLALAALEAQVIEIVEQFRSTDGISVEAKVVGDRPGGAIQIDHDLVRAAAAALDAVGVQPIYEKGSTDANYLLAMGLPAVTIGVTQGGNAHRLDEYIDPAPLKQGVKQVLLLLLAAAEWSPEAISRRPPAAGEQPSTTGEQAPAVSEPPSAASEQPPAAGEPPSSVGDPQTTT